MPSRWPQSQRNSKDLQAAFPAACLRLNAAEGGRRLPWATSAWEAGGGFEMASPRSELETLRAVRVHAMQVAIFSRHEQAAVGGQRQLCLDLAGGSELILQ